MLCCGERTIQVSLAEVVSSGGRIRKRSPWSVATVVAGEEQLQLSSNSDVAFTHTRGPEVEPLILPVTWRGREACFSSRPSDSRVADGPTHQVS